MGEDKLAGKWVSKLMDYFHDNFLTTDIEKTKVDERGWVVYVPSSASSQRALRHAEGVPWWLRYVARHYMIAYPHGCSFRPEYCHAFNNIMQ